jgi:hypothetical protein
MQNRSLVPVPWEKIGLAILPGLFAFGASWVVEAQDQAANDTREDVTALRPRTTG